MNSSQKAASNASRPELKPGLTYLETQMLRLLSRQQPITEMASIFHISQDECQYRVHALLQKLNANSPDDAIKAARAQALF